MNEMSRADFMLLSMRLQNVEALLQEVVGLLKKTGNITGIREAVLRKQNPALSRRFLQKIREEKNIGKRVGRDIIYSEEDIKTILLVIDQENKIKLTQTKD